MTRDVEEDGGFSVTERVSSMKVEVDIVIEIAKGAEGDEKVYHCWI